MPSHIAASRLEKSFVPWMSNVWTGGLWTGALFGWLAVCLPAHAEINRTLPRPLPSHPGNIFVAGEPVVVAAPPGESDLWRIVGYENETLRRGTFKDGKAEVGRLPVGWYKLVRGGPGYLTNRAFLCVIEPLRAPTPLTSPICLDVAMAWFWPKEKMGEVANLCQLAGINRVRDRLNWGEMEPKRGEFSGPNKYDDSARIQHDAGLQILQVNHLSAPWANTNAARFAKDLRDVYNFYRAMAARWQGQVDAFEPWNEADLKLFGGHTGSEMATMQKAAYLGLKAGNPNVTACLNVFAIRRTATLKDFRNNDAGPYFDTYNLHTYEPLENYPDVYAAHRVGSAGKPIWVSETSVHAKWRGDENLKELADEDLYLQSERLTKTYALGIHEGVAALYYFVLPHYSEHQLQYGLLRPDLTPRPSFVALAATGRLLADAKPLGRVRADNDSVQGYLFAAKPEGKSAKVLVAWSDLEESYELPKLPKACFDHLGRLLPNTNRVLNLSRAPVYAVLENNTRFRLVPPPKPAKLLTDKPGKIVIQAFLPDEDTALNKSAHVFAPVQTKPVPLYLYNFGTTSARGKLIVTTPKKWKAELPSEVELAPAERKLMTLKLTSPTAVEFSDGTIRVQGEFGTAGKSVLSFRLTAQKD